MAKTRARRRAAVVAVMAALLWLCGCPPKSALQPAWNSSRLDFGQGQLVVDLRVRWVAVGDAHGALIKTPEGAEAYLRVFNCSHGSKHIRDELRSALRSRLLSAEFVRRGAVFAFRWQERSKQRKVHWTAVKRHGPLVIAVSSETIPLDDVVEITQRAQLVVPVPYLQSCLPLCGEPGSKCKAGGGDDNG
ncbi:MAG: hypothetical protein KC503_06650 [Myxococcales bacterium]|nr:hypothetical protein [Myxococcales bacterium]